MTYISGFMAAVSKDNKDDYLRHAEMAAPIFKEFGATRVVEGWEDDIKDGKHNDLRTAVKAGLEEAVVFSWFEYPDKATYDAANKKMESDPRMNDMVESMPFDGKRLIYGGFEPLYDKRASGSSGYIDGCLIPVPQKNREPFATFAEHTAQIFVDHGAVRVIDAWGDDVPSGELTDFGRAVLAEDGEVVDIGWIEWPSKEIRDKGWEKAMQDARMSTMQPPFDGKRMVFGGFTPMLDSKT